MSTSRTSHWDVMVEILQYLKSAPRKELLYSNCGHNRIAGFSHADWADCPIDRGLLQRIVFVGENLVSRKSKK